MINVRYALQSCSASRFVISRVYVKLVGNSIKESAACAVNENKLRTMQQSDTLITDLADQDDSGESQYLI